MGDLEFRFKMTVSFWTDRPKNDLFVMLESVESPLYKSIHDFGIKNAYDFMAAKGKKNG